MNSSTAVAKSHWYPDHWTAKVFVYSEFVIPFCRRANPQIFFLFVVWFLCAYSTVIVESHDILYGFMIKTEINFYYFRAINL